MRPKQLTIGGSVNALEGPRLKIQIRPTGHDGPVKAVAMVTIASAVTVYPIRIMQGKNGVFAAMPQQEKNGNWKDVVYPINRKSREYLQQNIVAAYFKTEEGEQSETIIQGYCHPEIQVLVVPVTKAGSNLVAMASAVLEDIKIDGISVYRNRDGSMKLYYPQRRWVENGESRIADILLLTDTYKDELREMVTMEYERIMKRQEQKKEVCGKGNSFHDFDQRETDYDKMMQERWMQEVRHN